VMPALLSTSLSTSQVMGVNKANATLTSVVTFVGFVRAGALKVHSVIASGARSRRAGASRRFETKPRSWRLAPLALLLAWRSRCAVRLCVPVETRAMGRCGAQLAVDMDALRGALKIALLVLALYSAFNNMKPTKPSNTPDAQRDKSAPAPVTFMPPLVGPMLTRAIIVAMLVGVYDGFFGPVSALHLHRAMPTRSR
jgi:uncharacterized membrane protein YfcA